MAGLSGMLMPLAVIAALVAASGLMQTLVGTVLAWRFCRRPAPAASDTAESGALPAVTVLKPLFGAEPMLEQALASLCRQDYPAFQIVFGVQDARDPAIAVVRRLQARFPACQISLCVDGRPHGRNRKVANLMNMFALARHDVLVIADSDVHASPDYLRRLVATLGQPGVGLATTLYAGLPATGGMVGALGATAITHSFLLGVLSARALGRQDCLGATMALRRETLADIGGLRALVQHIADDHALGELVRARGLRVALADTVPGTTVPEDTFDALLRHELRWSRTIRAVAPVGFVLSAIQYPLAWAALAVPLSGAEAWSCALFLGAWAVRAMLARATDALLGLAPMGLASAAPIWLLPLRDIMSIGVMLAACAGNTIEWRGYVLRTGLAQTRLSQTGLSRVESLPLGTEQP